MGQQKGLGIAALSLACGTLLLWGLRARPEIDSKATLYGTVLGVFGSILCLSIALIVDEKGEDYQRAARRGRRGRRLPPSEPPPPAGGAEVEVVTLGTSGCGYCQKFASRLHEMSSGLAAKGISHRYISDSEAPEEFKAFSARFRPKAFPTHYVLADGRITQFDGYLEPSEFVEAVDRAIAARPGTPEGSPPGGGAKMRRPGI